MQDVFVVPFKELCACAFAHQLVEGINRQHLERDPIVFFSNATAEDPHPTPQPLGGLNTAYPPCLVTSLIS